MWTPTAPSLVLLLVGLSVFPEALAKSAQRRAASRFRRRLEFADGMFIWGTCDDWTHNVTGCTLEDGLKCSSHLSDGPTDYDVSLTITALPPSTEDAPVYLQWWAARKSSHRYFPQISPYGCSIYRNIQDAYPHYNDTDFNGGNVKVSSNGTATVRVRAPATYRVSRWLLLPHIHLRLCSGVNFAHSSGDSIFFTWYGPRLIKGSHGASHAAMLNGTWTPNLTSQQQQTTTTSLAAVAQSSTTTTILEESEEQTMDDSLIQEAIDALDMDALEFSPIYQCLLLNKFYSYWTSTCVEECPADADVVVGQCVSKAVSTTETTLESAWSLEVACAEYCWHDKLNVTLHHVRIAVADQMKIPFQEVKKVTLTISRTIASRRLSNSSATHVATLKVGLASTRVTTDDLGLLENFIDETNSASWLLGFDVYEVAHISVEDADADSEDDDEVLEITNASDPYANAYDEVAPLPKSSATRGSFFDDWWSLPFLMAVALFSVGCALTVFYVFRRKSKNAENNWQVPTPMLDDGNMVVVSGRPTAEADLPAWVDPGKPSLVGASGSGSGSHIPEPTKQTCHIPEPTKPYSSTPSAAAAPRPASPSASASASASAAAAAPA